MAMLKYLVLLLASFVVACTAQATPALSGAEAFTLTSPSFAQGESIPQQFTCQGDNVSPELAWTEPPAGTRSLALLVEDPDAPLGTWVHWVVYNLPADARGLPQGVSTADLPTGTLLGKTSFGRPGYGGPCPPSGQHHYYFRLYALDSQLDGQELDKPALLKAMEGHILAQAELMGVYQKP
jgi:Raf kinase inhibitor-like YbhB/YbcL family protein